MWIHIVLNMIAYKLVRILKDGTISSLFINKKDRLKFDEWLIAESHQTKGFSFRKGWHCTSKPIAPHLSMKNRVWVEVQIEEFETIKRPESQGGLWFIAQKMKINKII